MPKSIDSLRPRSEDTQPKNLTTQAPSGDLSSVKPHSYTGDKENNKRADRRSWFKKYQQRILLITIGFLLILVVVGLALWQKQRSDLSKAEQKTEQDAKSGLAGLDVAKKLSNEDKDKLYQQVGPEYTAAQELGIAPDPNNSQDQGMVNFLSNGPEGVETSAKAILAFINNRLATIKKTGYVEGYLYSYWFGSSAVKWPETFNVPGRGSAQVLADDKKYASDKIAADKQRLQKGEVTSDQLVAEILSDSRLRMFEDPNGSSKFTTMAITTAEGDKSKAEVREAIAAMSVAGLSDVKTRNYISVYDTSKTSVEAGYFFIEVRKVMRGETAVKQYEAEVAKAKAAL